MSAKRSILLVTVPAALLVGAYYAGRRPLPKPSPAQQAAAEVLDRTSAEIVHTMETEGWLSLEPLNGIVYIDPGAWSQMTLKQKAGLLQVISRQMGRPFAVCDKMTGGIVATWDPFSAHIGNVKVEYSR